MNKWIIAALASCVAAAAQAETLNVQMNAVGADGVGKSVGQVSIETSDYGLVFRPQLSDLQPGVHGFHIHAKGSCETAEIDGKTTPAGAAGGHWDPKNTGKHGEPWGDGHMGDLPALYVESGGTAKQPVLAPRLKSLGDIKGLALMVHQGGDNHADHPQPLGGGGARVACGLIK
ncbi:MULTISPECIES: superoxide dismutase family protein [Stutzerimonas]|jgi:Cu-Zn family superoxide dismutase|uniref:Superoxide dismutase [Cu-Zn] n=1 Tax=Stutzerimonas balearica DSM 6083 TaxID=1123016 RepID=A0A8D3Y222_9GAMM|nr:superoxide dismutase family protein [Stutzerimonas balearica]MBZ5756722.1 superoxide dismutase family protein [Pseudomonas sp. S5(2021)]WIX01439.1 superoxide dismutase [Cu-Zn] SodC [Pseudomonas sp. AR5]HCW94411.1 superoxide dismutase [Cu-Zn] SodC1 [Pseudomonas sp.]AJE15798.1 superoxide dismutase [Stutzerimonas balearica DSM 6083]MBD3737341.1 superoxide dismutase family protein [Stutzerimonas balearica]